MDALWVFWLERLTSVSLNCPHCGSKLSLSLAAVSLSGSLDPSPVEPHLVAVEAQDTHVEAQNASVEHVVALELGSKASPKRNRFQYNDPQFNAFWELYLRRVGKEAAAQTWQRLIVAGVEAQVILDAAARAGANWVRLGTELQFIPYPQKWLNEGHFLNEMDAPPAVGDVAPETVIGSPEWQKAQDAEYERIQREMDDDDEAMS